VLRGSKISVQSFNPKHLLFFTFFVIFVPFVVQKHPFCLLYITSSLSSCSSWFKTSFYLLPNNFFLLFVVIKLLVAISAILLTYLTLNNYTQSQCIFNIFVFTLSFCLLPFDF